MITRLEKLEKQNKELKTKLNKYQHTYFGPLYLLSVVIIYFICQLFNVDGKYYLITNINNSTTFTIMGAFILGTMLGTCKLEYMRSTYKIKKKIKTNNEKIRKMKEPTKNKNIVKSYIKNSNNNTKKTNKKITDFELEKKYLEIIIKSVEEIMQKDKQILENTGEEDFMLDLSNIKLLEPIDIEKIKILKRTGK